MARNFPGKKNVLHFWTGADVVFDEEAAGVGRLFVYDNADVRDVAA